MKGTPFISNKILDSTSVALAISNHHHNQISEKKEKEKNKKETQIRKRDKAKMPTRPEQPVISKAPPGLAVYIPVFNLLKSLIKSLYIYIYIYNLRSLLFFNKKTLTKELDRKN
jgi:hypothetical protein